LSGQQIVPAPWQLSGNGLIVVWWADRRDRNLHRFTPPELREHAVSSPSLMMFVDYRSSDAGPYRELLFIPGQFRVKGRRRWSITRIYVSTTISVRSGRANWGIPKDLADFQVEGEPGGTQRVTVSAEGRCAASLEFEPVGPRFPVTGSLLPAPLRTLIQVSGDCQFEFAPTARGRIRAARLLRAESDPALFPAPGGGRILGVFCVPEFRMEFPRARISSPEEHV